jgi:hypothetical protein
MTRYEVKLLSCQLDTIEKVSIRYYSMWMRKPLSPSELADKFMLRMPDGFRDRLAEAAAANKRSMNSEIIARLETTFNHDAHVSFDTRQNAPPDRAGITDERLNSLLDQIESALIAKAQSRKSNLK